MTPLPPPRLPCDFPDPSQPELSPAFGLECRLLLASKRSDTAQESDAVSFLFRGGHEMAVESGSLVPEPLGMRGQAFIGVHHVQS